MRNNRNFISWEAKSEDLYVLNLDPDFDPFEEFEGRDYKIVNYERKNFPGGEPHFRITDTLYPGEMVITHRINSMENLMEIVIANDAARRMGVTNIKLFIPYFPAARQDRVCNPGEALTVKIFADVINGCGFDEVVILTPHSEVAPALLNNVTVRDELEYVTEAVIDMRNKGRGKTMVNHFNIVCPDAGAGKRVQKAIQHLSAPGGVYGVEFNLIRCEKVRDVKDGSLKEFVVAADDLNGYNTLILDDILSYGGTFKGLGLELRNKNCGPLGLFTSHSDCKEGLENMVEFFDHVYTTNSKNNWGNVLENDKLICYDIKI